MKTAVTACKRKGLEDGHLSLLRGEGATCQDRSRLKKMFSRGLRLVEGSVFNKALNSIDYNIRWPQRAQTLMASHAGFILSFH